MRQTQEFWTKSNPRELMVFVLVLVVIIVGATLLFAEVVIPEFIQLGFTTIIGFFTGSAYQNRRNGGTNA